MALPDPTLGVHRIEIGVKPGLRDARGAHVARQVREFLHLAVDDVRTRDVYHLECGLSDAEAERVVAELRDPVLHDGAVGRIPGGECDAVVTVSYKPGVADPVGKSALVAVADTLGRDLPEGSTVYTSVEFLLGGIGLEEARTVALELLGNPVIQDVRVSSFADWCAAPPDLAVPRMPGGERPPVRRIDLSGEDAELEALSRDGLLALSLAEMKAIRDHFRETHASDAARDAAGLGPEPTDVELECLAQTWSEHCKHKIFNATIEYRDGDAEPEIVRSLFDTYIRRVTREIDAEMGGREGDSWLVSVFHDNAGVVAFDEEIHLVYKVETHNSPSALDPYGGAITGIVGVNRDPFGTGRGADLLVNVWGYCFASPYWQGDLPSGLLHPRRIRDGVHRGVIDGGNQSGVPYGRGWERFDDRYLGKPLVFCGTVGALPVTIAGTPGEDKRAEPGDAVVMVGGRIGADGIHGATFSSAALDEASPSQAVQIGDPITQKMMFDFLLEARDLGLYNAITDNGAGGLSSSVGEMAEGPGGARLDLAAAPLKYAGLAPWEIFLSEAQERMTVAVPPRHVNAFLELAARRQVEASVLGKFTSEPVLEVRHGAETVARLDMGFLHGGLPEMRLSAHWERPSFPDPPTGVEDCRAALLALVGRPNLASNESKARHYDHEVKALTVVKPWVGVERDVPAEATVFLARHGTTRGFVLAEGVNPYLSDLDAEAMAATVVDEAVRRLLCAGAGLDRIAALDNFCWPDPVHSEGTPDGEQKLAQLVRACRGLYAACRAYGVPLVSGKDSMKNEAVLGGVKIAVPPTLLVSAIGQIDDVRRAVTLDFKQAGDIIYVLGETGNHLGGSELYRWLGETASEATEPGGPAPYVGSGPPTLDPGETLPLYRALAEAQRRGWVRSAATPTLGGLAVALTRSALGGRLGATVDLDACPGGTTLPDDRLLFSESNGRFVATVAPGDAAAFEERFASLPAARVGTVEETRELRFGRSGESRFAVGLDELLTSFQGGLSDA